MKTLYSYINESVQIFAKNLKELQDTAKKNGWKLDTHPYDKAFYIVTDIKNEKDANELFAKLGASGTTKKENGTYSVTIGNFGKYMSK